MSFQVYYGASLTTQSSIFNESIRNAVTMEQKNMHLSNSSSNLTELSSVLPVNVTSDLVNLSNPKEWETKSVFKVHTFNI